MAAKMSDVLSKIELGSQSTQTDAERKKFAEDLYRAQLNTALTNAENSYVTGYNALEGQRQGINTGYDQQRASQERANAQSVAASDRAFAQRGMQRSSYGATTTANLRARGDEAVANIEANRAAQLNQLNYQQSALATARQNEIANAQAGYQASVLAKMEELRQQEQQRNDSILSSNNNTLLQWASLLKQSGGGSRTNNNNQNNSSGGADGTDNDPILQAFNAGRTYFNPTSPSWKDQQHM